MIAYTRLHLASRLKVSAGAILQKIAFQRVARGEDVRPSLFVPQTPQESCDVTALFLIRTPNEIAAAADSRVVNASGDIDPVPGF